MNTKKRAIAFVICLFLLVALGIVYIFSELYNENDINEAIKTDAKIFKEEYEKINGEEIGDGNTIRVLDINESNPFKYKKDFQIVEMIDNKESFIVYFGFSTCPWCRSVIPSLIEAAKENNIDTIYYVDVKDIRDKFELNEDNKAIRVTEGTDGYYKLLERLDPVLEVYSPLTYKTKKNKLKYVKIDEKRIYAPSVVAVKNGVAVGLETGISNLQTDAYMEITDELNATSKEMFKCLFDLLKDENDYACSCDDQKC